MSEEEASELALELQKKLRDGEKPETDTILIKKLVTGLGDKRGLLRRTFSESLGMIGKSALPELRYALLNSCNVTVRRAAAKTLKLIGDPSALPDLLQALLHDHDPVVQGSAVGAMAIFGEEAAELLIEVLAKPNSSELQCGLASWGISFIGARAGRVLKRSALSTNKKVRASSIAALGDQIQLFSDKEAKKILCDAVNDPSIEVQIEAIKLIGFLNDHEWDINLIASKLNEASPEIRRQSALTLMKLKAINHIAIMNNILLKEKDTDVKNILKLCISNLDGMSKSK
ncbi:MULTISPECIES: HEAT repeat domain-containing protein [unclassified Prochlorococcus]|uniref:HEAT repeat domain-containing protein n=1 Tax=unclassified Prochlorococcus TaxID=2627481 RepID=UPI000533A21B|nr:MULTISPECIES: HEAT repeat domain-containing protein [unclassified Prochlorococcus]KGG16619.1 Bilin biosynthesis protein MpeU [Prochlorococcus sp. MIT 0602]